MQIQPKWVQYWRLGSLRVEEETFAVKLVSKTKRDKMTAVVGLAVFSQFCFWHPLVYFLSLAFSPTFLIGLNYDCCCWSSCPFLHTRVQPPCPPPVEFPTAVLSTLARAKARASDADKMQMDSCKLMNDIYDLEFEMVNQPVDKDSTLNDTITSSCDLGGTNTIGHAINIKMDLEFEMVNRPDNQDSTRLNDMITSSTELIDTAIDDATNNKKTLASTMDLVISLMRQVESEEKAAGQAKAEAAISGLDIRLKVEELKQAQQRAKETNETHAKEVYSQKDVIATQMKELQSRMSDVLHEGRKSVTILDEMRIALEKRLASALKEKESAEKEKLEKETLAREALAYEESQMKNCSSFL